KGTITIEVFIDDTSWHLHYHDNGKGIHTDHLAKIFHPFFTTKRFQRQKGLGMHIVYTLVTQRLRGTIECQSTPGEGATFRIHAPLQLE
ncbi:sensor histidine kinase, partial [candidate division KSB3 bacterium]|nr:sensor histidine kinase [candidate division KSB3 bacterium]MBD3327149.1 sensor histidine kinase [candidate division KSB3 bacterium]